MKPERLKELLMVENPSNLIRLNEKEFFKFIPELKRCKGFDQHNDWHIYDVYEHILHVVDRVPKDYPLRIAALFHDLGKPESFTLDEKGVGHFYGHWQKSLDIFKKYANKLGITPEQIKIIAILIYYHDISLDKVDDDTLVNIGKSNIKPLYELKEADLLAQNSKYYSLLGEYYEQEERTLNRIDKITQTKIEEILTSEDIVPTIRNNTDYLTSVIPDLKYMIGFPHNHPHHHLDVWEHTLLALSLSKNDFETRLTLLLHDIGKPFSFQDEEVRHFHGHADVSASMSKRILTNLGYSEDIIKRIVYLVKTHDTEITRDDIQEKLELTLKRLHIQECDSKAHNPQYQSKRLEYIEQIKKLTKST